MLTLPGLGWDLQSYGVLLTLAVVLGWVVVLALARRDGLPTPAVGGAYVRGAGVGLVMARVAWILQQPAEASSPAPELVTLGADGLDPFVGVVAGGIVAGLHAMRRRVPVLALFDAVAPALAAAAMVERLGALLAGSGFGRYAPTLPWAVRFPEGSPAYVAHEHALRGLLGAAAERSLPVHPTQLYAIAVAGAALGVGLWLRRRRSGEGRVVVGTLVVALLGRAFVEEWFRADAGAARLGPLDALQVSAVVLAAAVGAAGWAHVRQGRGKGAGRATGTGPSTSPGGGAEGRGRKASGKASGKAPKKRRRGRR